MTIIQSFILGIIEGLTEFLPVSSTGHLIYVSQLLHIASSDFVKTFEISIQLGAILAVVVLYFQELIRFTMIKKLTLAFLPTGIAGFLLFKRIKALLDSPLTVTISLLVGGIIILIVEYWYAKHAAEGDINGTHEVTYKQAFILGCIQILSMIPGVSRSGSVIVGGLIMRLPRALVTEFTFLLAVPTMLAATLYSIYKDHSELAHISALSPLLVGFVTSFVVALVVIKYFLMYIRSHSFAVFGIYRIIIAIIAFAIIF